MPTLLNLIKEITTDMPRILTDQRNIYIKSRNITPGVQSMIVERKASPPSPNWHELACIQDIQIHACESDWTPEKEIESLNKNGLLEDIDNIDILQEVITPKEAEELYGVKLITVYDACKNNHILARQSGSTWLFLRSDAEKRWGNKTK